MVEEKPEEKKEEPKEEEPKEEKPKVLEEAQKVKEGLDESIAKAKELQATQILSGHAEVKVEDTKPTETNVDYAKRALEGKVEE